jgi:hypothetical protein
MSKKQLLTENEVRRFMRLANIPALGKNLVAESEAVNQIPQDTRRPETAMTEEEMPGLDMGAEAAPALPAGEEAGMEGGTEVEMGGDVDPEKQKAFEAAVQALADSMGISVELESQEEHAEEGGEEMHDLDAGGEEEDSEGDEEEEEEGGEEEMQETVVEKKEEKEEEEEEEMEESQKLSEDELVEAVLSRVTARLVAEAKKKKSKVKAKMELKKKEKKEEKKEEEGKKKMEEATEAKGGGPLLSKGGNKHDVFKGHADMKMGKGEKGGSGGHKLETVTAKSEHTVTHGTTNLATKGGNKKK